jgi:hypothetical protein
MTTTVLETEMDRVLRQSEVSIKLAASYEYHTYLYQFRGDIHRRCIK